ncbi:hypothetical protein AAV94_09355 [Lampropedia cohaerens]|uniref:Ferredoxin--NADP reductase n=1 Tax=Lampropedia cohaerens TaxID=1610491 RepID=A0A0U1PZ73_9BURK|nr:NAD(P)/FAD-dependent oxidoreductase [Lampropedia cohaerens]KKW67813.1 hypothetical protein AAV94_09355 [Lampropedia cohaerens]
MESPPSKTDCDVVVVGAGPAGLYQLFQLGLQGLSCHALDALPHPGGQCAELYPRKPIYDIPGFTAISGHALAERLHQQLAPFPIGWHWGHTACAIENLPDGRLLVRSQQGLALQARAIVLALGVGAFVPRLPRVDGLEALLAQRRQVFVQTQDRAVLLAGQRVVVHGGDETAVAKVLQLAALPADQRPSDIVLLHRRDVFKADAADLQQLAQLRISGQVQVVVGQLQGFVLSDGGEAGALRALRILDTEGREQTLMLDILLLYQGISPKLAALQDWGLALDGKLIAVDPATQQSSRTGIYAIGDIASYPGKRKLIVSAFQEAIAAGYAIAERHHGKPLQTLYTTTSSLLLERLGQAG